MEDQPPHRPRRLCNLPPLSIVESPLPPQRQRLDTNSSFELTGVSQSPGEPKLCYNHTDRLLMDIEYFQDEEFERN